MHVKLSPCVEQEERWPGKGSLKRPRPTLDFRTTVEGRKAIENRLWPRIEGRKIHSIEHDIDCVRVISSSCMCLKGDKTGVTDPIHDLHLLSTAVFPKVWKAYPRDSERVWTGGMRCTGVWKRREKDVVDGRQADTEERDIIEVIGVSVRKAEKDCQYCRINNNS
ncbi:hypothetical protein TNCV_2459571 [Trichonephila clavipes]|nr:hypothetical protein TNCV_2459571 [Trichonephila clavipes]